jgi:general secretion pathway protein L
MSHPTRHWRRFVRWWLAELAGLFPSSVTGRLLGQGTVLPMRLDGNQLHIEGAPPLPLEAAALPRQAAARVAQADAVVLVLPAAMVLRRTIDIPAAAWRELASAVPFLVERHTPFLPGQAHAAHRVIGRDAGRGKIRVELAVTAAAPLGLILARLHQLGISAGAIHVEGDDRLPRLDFAGTRLRRPMRSWLAEPWHPLLAATLALLLAGPAVVAAVVHARAHHLAATLSAGGAGPQAQATLRARLRAEVSLARTLAARVAAPDPLAVLDRATQALPASSWVFRLDLTPQSLQLGGFSTDMPEAVARLQALPGVQKLEFRAPVIHDAHADRDRFDILLHLDKLSHAQRVSP